VTAQKSAASTKFFVVVFPRHRRRLFCRNAPNDTFLADCHHPLLLLCLSDGGIGNVSSMGSGSRPVPAVLQLQLAR
jgi:hypothetical protein